MHFHLKPRRKLTSVDFISSEWKLFPFVLFGSNGWCVCVCVLWAVCFRCACEKMTHANGCFHGSELKWALFQLSSLTFCVSNYHLINIKNLLKMFTPNGREYEKHTLKMEHSISRVLMLCTFLYIKNEQTHLMCSLYLDKMGQFSTKGKVERIRSKGEKKDKTDYVRQCQLILLIFFVLLFFLLFVESASHVLPIWWEVEFQCRL